MADIRFPPVPPDVRDELSMMLAGICVDSDERWKIRVMVRGAYARGFDDGYGDGRRDGSADDIAARDAKEKAEKHV